MYADIGSRERAQAHARAAGMLAESDASEERIAAQLVEAEPAGDPERVELLRRVAADALARGAPAAAVAWLGRALAEPPPPASRGGARGAQLRAASLGTPEAAIDQLMAATEVIQGAGPPDDGDAPGGRRADGSKRRPRGRSDRARDGGRRARGPGAGVATRGGPRRLRPAGQP